MKQTKNEDPSSSQRCIEQEGRFSQKNYTIKIFYGNIKIKNTNEVTKCLMTCLVINSFFLKILRQQRTLRELIFKILNMKAPNIVNGLEKGELTQQITQRLRRKKHTNKMARESEMTTSPSTRTGTQPRGLSFKNSALPMKQ